MSSSSPTTRAVVVEPDREVAKKIGAYLERSNISPSFVADGGDALLRILRSPPELVVIGGQLRGLPSRALVEIVRRSPQLAALKLVRVASTNEPAPSGEFEADATIAAGDLPDALGPHLARFGIGSPPSQSASMTSARTARSPEEVARPKGQEASMLPPARAAGAVPAKGAPAQPSETLPVHREAPRAATRPPSSARRQPAKAPGDPRIAEAERLARIIVSDIVLYNEDRFDRAAREGDLRGALKSEFDEGRALFHTRIPEDVRAKRDFLQEELERVAADRLSRAG